MADRKLTVTIVGDASKLNAAAKSAEKSVKGLGDVFGGVGKDLGGFEKQFGQFGKVAGGVGKKLDSLGGLAPKLGIAAGAAGVLGAAAFAAVGRFEDLGVAVGRFSDATQLSTEQSSRWIEVAGDIGISTESIQMAFGKMEKALATSPKKFDELGIAIRHTSDGAVDVQGTFLGAVDALNRIQDPLARQKAAAEIFGKSWQSMSELVGMGSTKITEALNGVSDAKVFSAAEVEKAKKYREAMDKLHDAFDDLVLTAGQELAPALTAVANALGTIAKVAGPAVEHIGGIVSAATGGKAGAVDRLAAGMLTLGGSEVTRGLKNVAGAIGGLFGHGKAKDEVEAVDIAVLQFTADAWKMRDAGIANAEAWAKQTASHDLMVAAQLRGNHAQEEFNATVAQTQKEADAAAKAIAKIDAAWAKLAGDIDAEQAQLDLDAAFKNLPKNRQEVLALKRQVNDYAQSILKIPPSVATKIDAMIDRGEYEAAKRLLDSLAATRKVTFSPTVYDSKDKNGSRAGGGRTSGGLTLVGEYGPELVNLPTGAHVSTASATSSMMASAGAAGPASGPVVIQLVLDGRVVTEVVHDGLLTKQRRTPLGLTRV